MPFEYMIHAGDPEIPPVTLPEAPPEQPPEVPGEPALETMRCELVSWGQFRALARQLALRVRSSGFRPDMIVAIGRGGYMPARLLSDYLDIYNLSGFKIEHYRRAQKLAETRVRYPLAANVKGLKLLLVDDVSDAGSTLEVAVSHLHERGPPAEIRTAVLHHKTVSSFVPDFYAAEITEWRWLIYPWAILEDVSGFIRELGLVDASPKRMQAEIEAGYGVRISGEILSDANVLARGNSG
ncbi:MAG: phosphoribosyltransferase [Gammaproteobacteria bacterium]|nr:MAG: phosphoribosyltransferase [Gammaproteobacteria bacterium]